MTEDSLNPSPNETFGERDLRRIFAQGVLFMTLGIFFTTFDACVAQGHVDFPFVAMPYVLIAVATWPLRASSRWFRIAALLAVLVGAIRLAVESFFPPHGPWIAFAHALGEVAMISFALAGAVELARRFEAPAIASRLVVARACLWIATILALMTCAFGPSDSMAALFFAHTPEFVAFGACAIVLAQLAAKIGREPSIAQHLSGWLGGKPPSTPSESRQD